MITCYISLINAVDTLHYTHTYIDFWHQFLINFI